MKAQCRIDRDKALEAIGLENCDQDTIEKIIEVQNLSRKLEEETLKGAQKVLKEAPGVTPQFPVLKISLIKSHNQSTSQRSVTFLL